MSSYLSHSVEETSKIASQWLESVASRKGNENSGVGQATVVGLSGHLGAGKTAFVKAVAKHLGIADDITSPTFVIMKIYPTGEVGPLPWKKLIHIDAYRLEASRELEAVGFESLVADQNNLIMVEWPEQVKEIMPQDCLNVGFEDIDGVKKITW